MKVIDRQQLISDVSAFIRRYVVCSDDQLAVLALWAMTGYFHSTSIFPYSSSLNIYSAVPQSGKTTLLKTLWHLAYDSWYTSGVTARVILTKMQYFGGTLLLDDRHVTFSSSERQSLVAYFNAGSAEFGWHGYLNSEVGTTDHSCFAPKAFAGDGPMPRSLASRCIPINLERCKPSDPIELLRWDSAIDISGKIVDRLERWAKQDRENLRPLGERTPADMPPGLTPHQQHSVEPLVHIADLIGGPWPAKIRLAISHIFAADAPDISGTLTQLLSDIRDFFTARDNPVFIPSRDILTHLHGLEERPWKHWKGGRAMTPHALARELHPLHIHSCLDWNNGEPANGYRYQTFLASWNQHLSDASFAAIPENISAEAVNSSDLTLQNIRNSQSISEIPRLA